MNINELKGKFPYELVKGKTKKYLSTPTEYEFLEVEEDGVAVYVNIGVKDGVAIILGKYSPIEEVEKHFTLIS